MKSNIENGIMVGSLLSLFIFGLLLPFFIVNVMELPAYQLEFSGEPIEDTAFVNISSSDYNTAMLPGGDIMADDGGVRLIMDYSNHEKINQTTAIESVLLFSKNLSYLEGRNVTLDTGWTLLGPTGWTFRFLGTDFDIYAVVNAFTGIVKYFKTDWQGPSPYVRDFNGTNPMTQGEIEERALVFFQSYGFSLHESAMYQNPVVEYDISFLSHYVYSLRFFNVINETLILGNVVTLNLDIESGEMVGFSYSWTHIPNIPIHDSIERQEAEKVVENYINSLPTAVDFRIDSSVRVFKNFKYSILDYHLTWAVSVTSERYGTIHVDAINQDILAVYETVSASPYLQQVRFQIIELIIIFIPSLSIAVIGFFIVKTRIWKILSRSNEENNKRSV